jgi:hypothetical protein
MVGVAEKSVHAPPCWEQFNARHVHAGEGALGKARVTAGRGLGRRVAEGRGNVAAPCKSMTSGSAQGAIRSSVTGLRQLVSSHEANPPGGPLRRPEPTSRGCDNKECE